MAVHAHPDDESSSTGGVLARYSPRGRQTVLVTCTNGEYGDGPDHVKPGEPGHDPEQVAKKRLAELDEACQILGVAHLETLGYHDSGMPDWAYKDAECVFCNVPLEESVGRLVALVERYRPDVIVTYDDVGGYNHPDHLRPPGSRSRRSAAPASPASCISSPAGGRDWEKPAKHAAVGIEMPPPPRGCSTPR